MAMVTSVQKLKLSPTLKTIPISLTINNVRLLVYNGRPGEGNPVKDTLRAVSLFLENRAYLFCVLPHGFLRRRETARSLCKRLLLETEIWPTLPELTITVKSNVFCFVLFCFVFSVHDYEALWDWLHGKARKQSLVNSVDGLILSILTVLFLFAEVMKSSFVRCW